MTFCNRSYKNRLSESVSALSSYFPMYISSSPDRNLPPALTSATAAGSALPLFERFGGRGPLMILLRHFYADLRQHSVLGPIFNDRIKDWPAHLETIADFWTRVTGGPALYGGAMVARHIPLQLEAPHFEIWLGLWEHHCRAWLSSETAVEMVALARQIAPRLLAASRHARPVTIDPL